MEIVGPHENLPTSEQLQRLGLVRKCVEETVILGYHIPAGVFNQSLLSRDPRYFKDPLKFDPDCWSHDVDQIHPFASYLGLALECAMGEE